MRKWREIHSLDFLIFSFFHPSLSISYIKIVIFCRKMSTTDFCRECHKKLNMRYEKIILGRIRCEEAPQVVPTLYTVYSMHRIEYSQVQGEPQGFQSDPPASRR